MIPKTKMNKLLKWFILIFGLIMCLTLVTILYSQLFNGRIFLKDLVQTIFDETLVSHQEKEVTAKDLMNETSSLQLVDEVMKQNTTEKLLYRKRRYLQFPEGSSLQLVFNILLPIIDYTNYAILGITCALAYELPSKPLSELEDELLKKLHKDSHKQQEQNRIPLDNNHHHYQKHIPDKFSEVIYIDPSEYAHAHENSYHTPLYSKFILGPYSPSDFHKESKYTNSHYNSVVDLKKVKNSKFDFGNLFERSWKPNYLRSSHLHHGAANNKPQHAVYHIMGRRSILENHPIPNEEENNSWLNKLDRIHLRYHRSSRHTLYSKLEAMFDKQGKNGTECVLRALCETGNRRHETEPGEVLTEVFRAVFTLPKESELYQMNYHPMHRARDDAHWNQKNCSQAYPLCENFIWERNFKI